MLDNCIEEVLKPGTCCASCIQKGCKCEGYQYYDCINAGFKNGKVPEGDSYFVDYGSTECSCPRGGGRISCHFISCPDMPPNCIEILEPADGCMQCERVGCIHDRQKYEAGHSFHIDPCRVCHCPNEGGKLMCYQVPDCDPDKVHKPMLPASTDDFMVNGRDGYPYEFDRLGPVDPFSTTYNLPSNGNLPLFKPSQMDKEEAEDYDYGPTEFPETYPQSLVFPTQSPSLNRVIAVSRDSGRPDRTSAFQGFDRRSKLELREHYGVRDHPAEIKEVTENPQRKEDNTVRPHAQEDATTSWQQSQGLTSVQSISFSDLNTETDLENPLHAHKTLGTVIFPLTRDFGSEILPEYPQLGSETAVHHERSSKAKTHPQNASDSVTVRGSEIQINISPPVPGTENQINQQRPSDRVDFPLYTLRGQETPIHPEVTLNGEIQLQGTFTPYEEGADEDREEEEEMEEEETVTLENVAEPEEEDVLYDDESEEQERSHEEADSSYLVDSYETTTTKPSTSSPTWPEFTTTPAVQFITTTTPPPPSPPPPPPPVKVRLDESQPSRKPDQRLVDLHSEDKEEVPEEVTENEREREDRPVFLDTPDESK